MDDREKAINDLNVSKRILCNPQMLTPEMCVRIGQAVTNAIALLKAQEAVKHSSRTGTNGFSIVWTCGNCGSDLYPNNAEAKYCSVCGRRVKWE